MTASSFQYHVYGLELQTSEHIPGLVPRLRNSKPDTLVHLNTTPIPGKNAPSRHRPLYASPERDSNGIPLLSLRDISEQKLYELSYSDGTEFLVAHDGNEIWCTWPERLTVEDTATYLLGPILGCVLRLKRITCLHASAFIFQDRVVALLGPAGSGKSTTVAALAKQGFPVVTDDVLALFSSNGQIEVYPGYPRLRLWPDSVETLFGSPDGLPQLTPNWEKCFLDLTKDGYRFPTCPSPLAAIYVMSERSSDPLSPAVRPLASHEALLRLIGNTYAKHFLNREMLAGDFVFFSHLLNRIPVRTLVPHAESSKISRLCDVILKDVEALSHQPS